jgi:hypothetical protein
VDADLARRTVTIVFDASSFPAIGQLTGTIFAIAVPAPSSNGASPAPPSATTVSLSPALALAAQGSSSPFGVPDSSSQSAGPETVPFRTSSRLNLNVNAAQDSMRETGSAERGGAEQETDIPPEDVKEFLEELLRAIKDMSKYFSSASAPQGDEVSAMREDAIVPTEEQPPAAHQPVRRTAGYLLC